MKKRKKLVFLTRDFGNGAALNAIASLAHASGHTVLEFYGKGQPFAEGTRAQVENALLYADCLIVSLSSSKERVEMECFAMEVAVRHGVPIAILSDMPGMIHRSLWGGNIAQYASLLTVVSESEVVGAMKYVGPETRILASVNPNWVSYFEPSKETGVREKLGIRADQKLVLVAGNKEFDRNEDLLRAIESIMTFDDLQFVITSHPGGEHEMGDLNLLHGIPSVRFVPKKGGVRTPDILRVADLVITSGGSGNTYEAAAQRMPVIDYMSRLNKDFWYGLSGLNFWTPAKDGMSAAATNPEELREGVACFCATPHHVLLSAMRIQQENLMRKQDIEGAARDILSAIEAL